jgi:phosphate transport system permease protein
MTTLDPAAATVDPYPPTHAAPPPAQPPDRPRPLAVFTAEDRLTLYGSMLSALALVWLLYTQILPFSGLVGFILCWFGTYLAMYAAVTALAHPRPIVVDRLWSAIVTGAAALAGLALLSTVCYTVAKGFAAVHYFSFLTKSQQGVSPIAPLNQGGILHAIVGSLIELGIATSIALPLGIGTAVFMVEVGGKFSRVVRTVVEAMTALPDILAGLFIYTVLIIHLGFERSGFCAAMALTVMMLPIIARSADVALRVVPGGLREASHALGASQWQTVWRVVLPTCRAGLATAVILGMARAIGETAPVLITSGANTFMNTDPLHNPMNSLPLYILFAVRSGQPLEIARGFGAAIILLTLVVVLFAAARYISRNKMANR